MKGDRQLYSDRQKDHRSNLAKVTVAQNVAGLSSPEDVLRVTKYLRSHNGETLRSKVNIRTIYR